jgi:glycosyltransferase involved in cell wall biosynthesis
MPEVIEDGITGLLVEPCAPEQIADAIKRYIDDPMLKDKCIRKARERVEKEYSFERLIKVFDESYVGIRNTI